MRVYGTAVVPSQRLREIVLAVAAEEARTGADYGNSEDFAECAAIAVLKEACRVGLTDRNGQVWQHVPAVDKIKKHFGLGDGDGE